MSENFSIAMVATACTPNSHADVLLRRWVEPAVVDVQVGWPGPRTRMASLAVWQKGDQDLSGELCRVHGIRECDTVESALTLGTPDLAVDAVMIVGEHGEFPNNALGQKLYPRKEMLDQVLAVFDRTGKQVPIFFDKHFSWNVHFARAMYAGLESRRVPWFGGSSISLCPFLPEPGDLRGEEFQEVVVTTWNALEAYLFHALEVLEAVVEQRAGGETGIDSIVAWRDVAAWQAMDRGEFSADLLEAALRSVAGETWASFQEWGARRDHPLEIFQLRYKDGLKATIVRLDGIIRKWAFGARVQGRETPVAAAARAGTLAEGLPHFSRLARRIEDFFLTGESPVPGSRLYLTTLACAYCMQALAQPGIPLRNLNLVAPTRPD